MTRAFETTVAKMSGDRSQPVVRRALVVLQGNLYCSESAYYMKEVWWTYLKERFLGLAEETLLAAPASRSARGRFQESRVEESVRVLELLGGLSTACALLRALRSADLVWVFLPSQRGLATALACAVLRVPYVVYLGGDIVLLQSSLPSWLLRVAHRCAVRFSGGVVAAGGELLAFAGQLQPWAEATVPAVGFTSEDVDVTAASLSFASDGPFRWLYVGNLHRNKRPDVVLRAFALWQQERDRDGELHMVGATPDAGLLGLAEELGVASRVRWHGYVRNGADLFATYRQSDVFVLASEHEGFPRVLYEAMAFGVPIVTTRVSGIPYLLRGDADCVMVPVDDPASIARGVASIQSDAAFRERLVRNALGVVRPIVAADGKAQVRRVVRRALAGC